MNRKLRPTKSPQQIKEEQVYFLLQDIEKNLEEYKTPIELRDKQLADTKRILKGAKVSYDSLLKENKQWKEYILGIKQRLQSYQKQQEEQENLRDTQYFRRPQKKYKKVVYEEESDSEPEAEESQYIPEEEPIEQEIEQKHQAPKKNKIFEYLNKDAKGNKQ